MHLPTSGLWLRPSIDIGALHPTPFGGKVTAARGQGNEREAFLCPDARGLYSEREVSLYFQRSLQVVVSLGFPYDQDVPVMKCCSKLIGRNEIVHFTVSLSLPRLATAARVPVTITGSSCRSPRSQVPYPFVQSCGTAMFSPSWCTENTPPLQARIRAPDSVRCRARSNRICACFQILKRLRDA